MHLLADISVFFESPAGTNDPAASGFWGRLLEWLQAHSGLAGTLAFLSLVMAIGYVAAIYFLITRMSPDYFVAREPGAGTFRTRHPAVRLAGRVVKNIVGAVLLVAGLITLVPLVPGQGLLTILIAVSLLDFPGKRRLELLIVSQRHVRRSIDWMRSRAGRPPLNLPDRPSRAGRGNPSS